MFITQQDPIPKKAWGDKEELDATKDGKICPQFANFDFQQHEDCLTLNVYTKEVNFDQPNRLQ